MSAVNSKRSWVQEMDEPQEGCKARKVAKNGGSRENSNSRKKSKQPQKEGSVADKPWPPKKPTEIETDPAILQRRQKQIDFGKNTVGYHNYITQVPIDKRTKDQPKTPDKFAKYSRRSWDMLIKLWRINLHSYDTDNDSGDENNIEVIEDGSDVVDEEEETD